MYSKYFIFLSSLSICLHVPLPTFRNHDPSYPFLQYAPWLFTLSSPRRNPFQNLSWWSLWHFAYITIQLSLEPWSAARKRFKLVWRCHQLLSRFLAKGHLPRVSRQLLLSTNGNGDSEIIPGAIQRSQDIFVTAEENSGKPQLGDRRWRLCLKWGALPPNEVGRIVQHVRKGEGKEDWKDECGCSCTWYPFKIAYPYHKGIVHFHFLFDDYIFIWSALECQGEYFIITAFCRRFFNMPICHGPLCVKHFIINNSCMKDMQCDISSIRFIYCSCSYYV